MSPVGEALHQRFTTVCGSELHRLRRKTASLSADERAQVDALVLELTERLAVTLDAAVTASGAAGVAPAVMRLFAVTAPALKEEIR